MPQQVSDIMAKLESCGHAAYVVGGCVRDGLLGREPHDWDVTTSASPEEMVSLFADEVTDMTGLPFGTLVVIRDGIRYEVTSYREDGPYSDHRHPDWTRFVKDINKDLVRRDFTMNAMAYSPIRGLVDPFDGQDDMTAGVMRCVGDPMVRFDEDAFRILRAIRFASVFGYTIDERMAMAIHALAPRLAEISKDRFFSELMKLLTGPGVGAVLRTYPDVLAVFIPSIADMVGYDQNNSHHRYDLWEHTVRAIENTPTDPYIRLAMLFHDTGKPQTRTEDAAGESHYRGHPDVSVELASAFIRDDRQAPSITKNDCSRVLALIRYHDCDLGLDEHTGEVDSRLMARRLRQFAEVYRDEGRDFVMRLLKELIVVHRADRIATGSRSVDTVSAWAGALNSAYDDIVSAQTALTRKDLAVKGNDIMAHGYRGAEVGQVLDRLFEAVQDGSVVNERDELLIFLNNMRL